MVTPASVALCGPLWLSVALPFPNLQDTSARRPITASMEASIYRMRLRDLLAVCVFSLLALGVLMVQSAAQHLSGRLAWDFSAARSGQVIQPEPKVALSPAAAARKAQMPVEQKNMIYAGLAVLAFLAVGHLNYKHLGRKGLKIWQSPAVWALALSGLTCVLVLVPGIGKEVNGARRWI